MASDLKQSTIPGSHSDKGANPFESPPVKKVEPVPAGNQEVAEAQTEAGAQSDNPGEPEVSFANQLKEHQDELETEFQEYARKLEHSGYSKDLSNMDWDVLEQRYDTEMAEKIRNEEDIMKDISTTVQQLMLWMRVSNEREAERARKRLRTRIAKVQMTERELQQKQEHEKKVRDAFEAAVKLLGGIT